MAKLTQASSSVSSSGSSDFDVFLNFSGEDTRNNFTSFLYKAMQDSGINVFIDSEKLCIGEPIGPNLERAIEGSKIFIPIFSSGYADSKWCLWELAQIVKCHRSNNRLLMPIYFNIDPSHVREQTGTFEKAFQEHEKNFKPDMVKSWRDALKWVGNLRGEVLDKTKNQADLVELVVERVRGELFSSTHLVESKYLIGIDSSVNELESLLEIGSNDVRYVGICGLGGVGKTTIAKALYNRSFLFFSKHSFLSDVRKQATEYRGLESLQNQLLKDILKIDVDISNYHEGKTLIEERLSKEKVLVVLDDVGNEQQVDALAGELKWFGPGSRVIITTRDKDILTLAKYVYMPQKPNFEHSLQLFSWYAFQRNHPPEDYMELSMHLVQYSGGLPLLLEVLGSYLSEINKKEVWESTIQKLKEIPSNKVMSSLKISYDTLEDNQKAMFLDAACFFIGWAKETIISIWEACGYCPESEIHGLIRRSLLKFDECALLRMHDQIRDMGRKIVLEESFMEPGRRSRLWSYRDILEVLEEHKGTNMIEGMSVPDDFPCDNFTSEPFQTMFNLKFLIIRSTNFVKDFSHLPSTLRCFIWRFCTWRIIPTNFYHNTLVYLDLSGSKIEQAWNGRPHDENKVFKELKVLNLSECKNLFESPDFSWFPSLERLDLRCCSSLKMLNESIGQLSKLKHLILKSCTSLEKLPDDLVLLKRLEVLNVMECFKLKELPRSMWTMTCLHNINLNGTTIFELPDDFSMNPNLMKLDIVSERLQSLPANMSSFKNLKQLNLFRCLKLKELPEFPSSLVELSCEYCYSLVQLPDLSMLKKLKTLKLKLCVKLEEIQGLEGTESLEELNVLGCYNLPHTPREILGQGKLLATSSLEDSYSFTTVDGIYNTRLILCLVFDFPDFPKFFPKNCRNIDIEISVSIRQKEKTTRSSHTIRIEHVKINPFQDTIFIHHFKGFDWFGIPLQGKDAIKILEPKSYPCRVKFWKLIYDNKAPDQKKPNEDMSALMVADFFNWSCVLNEASPSDNIDGIIDSDLVFFKYSLNAVMRKSMLKAGKRGHHGNAET